MLIRTHIGVSLDGFVATPDGRPALLAMPDFVPGESHGHPELIERCDAVVVGRTTFDPALGSADWPWPGKQVGTSPLPLRLEGHRTFPDGTVELAYSPT